MPRLEDQRKETFCQYVARGASAKAAWEASRLGPKPNGHQLMQKKMIYDRINELSIQFKAERNERLKQRPYVFRFTDSNGEPAQVKFDGFHADMHELIMQSIAALRFKDALSLLEKLAISLRVLK